MGKLPLGWILKGFIQKVSSVWQVVSSSIKILSWFYGPVLLLLNQIYY